MPTSFFVKPFFSKSRFRRKNNNNVHQQHLHSRTSRKQPLIAYKCFMTPPPPPRGSILTPYLSQQQFSATRLHPHNTRGGHINITPCTPRPQSSRLYHAPSWGSVIPVGYSIAQHRAALWWQNQHVLLCMPQQHPHIHSLPPIVSPRSRI